MSEVMLEDSLGSSLPLDSIGYFPQASFYRARYYDSVIGRFLSENPIGMSGGINFYAYVGNPPADLVDPSGSYARQQPHSKLDVTNISATFEHRCRRSMAAMSPAT